MPDHADDRRDQPRDQQRPEEEALADATEDLQVEVDRRAPAGAPCRLLLTNDDGLPSPGLRDLARTLAQDHEVVVAAPAEDVSGAGTGIGRIDAADPTRLERADFDGIEAYAVDGPPGLAVMAAHLGAFGPKPDLVVSGVNAGLNTGTSIIHSGTVGAALTGRTFGSGGVAFSLAPGDRWHWETAMPIARRVVAWLADRPELTTLNVNIPALPLEEVRGATWAPIDEFGHFRVASQRADGSVLDLEVHDRTSGVDPATDTARCLDGYVTLTLLASLGAVPPPPEDDATGVAGDPSGWLAEHR
jgi:5'-nucleotidase